MLYFVTNDVCSDQSHIRISEPPQAVMLMVHSNQKTHLVHFYCIYVLFIYVSNIKQVLVPQYLLSKHVLTESILSMIHSHAIHIATDSIYGTNYATADTKSVRVIVGC